MTRRERLYWADTVYDRIDRMKLVELVAQAGYEHEPDELADMSRSDLIDLLMDTQTEAEYDAEEAHEDYPLRRPVRIPVPAWLTATDRTRVNVRWEVDWRPALRGLLESDTPPDAPATARDGDIVVTVLGCTPPVVAAVEEVGTAPRVGQRLLLAQPVTWHGLWSVVDTKPPRPADARLSRKVSARLIRGLRAELEAPDPTFLPAGDCTYYRSTPTAIDVLAALQAHHRDGPRWARCASCDAHTSVKVHFERPIHDNVPLEIGDHLDDVVHLCGDCHTLMHPHSVAAQRRSLDAQRSDDAPACPSCGAGHARQIVWGLLAEPELLWDEDVIVAGCVIDGPIPAQWRCRSCGDEFATVSTTVLRSLTDRQTRPRPSRDRRPAPTSRPRTPPRPRNDPPDP